MVLALVIDEIEAWQALLTFVQALAALPTAWHLTGSAKHPTFICDISSFAVQAGSFRNASEVTSFLRVLQSKRASFWTIRDPWSEHR
jgi:hypothetical protein